MQIYKTGNCFYWKLYGNEKIGKYVNEGSFSVEVMINLRIRCRKSYMENTVQAVLDAWG